MGFITVGQMASNEGTSAKVNSAEVANGEAARVEVTSAYFRLGCRFGQLFGLPSSSSLRSLPSLVFLSPLWSLLAVLLFAPLFWAAAVQAEPLRVGVLATYSGPYADYGRQFDAGMQVFLTQHEQKLGGHEVVFYPRDVGGANPGQARRYAQELIARDKVDVLVGLDFSPNAAAIAPVVHQAQVPTLIMNAASSELTAPSPYLFRYSFTIQQVSAPMAHWLRAQGIEKVVTVVADYASGYDAELAFERTFAHDGGQVIEQLRVPLDTMDFSAYLRRIADAKPDAVFFFFPSGQMPTAFLKTWNERDMAALGIELYATGEATDDTYLPQIGADAQGLITSHHYSVVHPSDLNQAFVAQYQELYGDAAAQRPSYFAVAAYDALQALDQALRSVADTQNGQDAAEAKVGAVPSGAALQQALVGMSFESPRGPIRIDADTRDIVQTVYIREVQEQDGEWVNVECCGAYPLVADPIDGLFIPAEVEGATSR